MKRPTVVINVQGQPFVTMKGKTAQRFLSRPIPYRATRSQSGTTTTLDLQGPQPIRYRY